MPSNLIILSPNHYSSDNIANTIDTLNSNIITLLSNHRDPDKPHQPKALSKVKIIQILTESVSPNLEISNVRTEILQHLQDLEAQGEIISDRKNRYYCIAPPTVLANSREDIRGLLFRGDRSYLRFAHELFEIDNDREPNRIIQRRFRKFDRLQKKLYSIGIRLLTPEHLIEHLPLPQYPPKYILRCPIPKLEVPDGHKFFIYQAQPKTLQENRWQSLGVGASVADSSLVKITQDKYSSKDRYFWREGDEWYELDRETAILAMFQKDREQNAPLRVSWHTSEGRIDLRDIYLPPSYIKCLWQLCGATDTYRLRCVDPQFRPIIAPLFEKLGCQLV